MEESNLYNKKYSLSVILPVYNEEKNIEKIVSDSVKFLTTQKIIKDFEIIIVNDGSRDNTDSILRKFIKEIPNIKIITHCKNFGYGMALLSGLNESKYPLIFFMDADGQFDITEINKFVFYIEKYDIVIGYRYKRKDSLYRILLGKVYRWIIFLLFGLRFKDVNCGFKLFKREIFNENRYNCKGGVFYTEVLLKSKDKGYKIKEIPIKHFPRLKGKQTGAKPKIIFNAIIDLIKLKYFQIKGRIK